MLVILLLVLWVARSRSGESPLCEPGTSFARHTFPSALPLYPSVLPSLLIADNNNDDNNNSDDNYGDSP